MRKSKNRPISSSKIDVSKIPPPLPPVRNIPPPLQKHQVQTSEKSNSVGQAWMQGAALGAGSAIGRHTIAGLSSLFSDSTNANAISCFQIKQALEESSIHIEDYESLYLLLNDKC